MKPTKMTERKLYVGRDVNGTGGVECALGFTKIGDQAPHFHALAGAWSPMDRDYITCANHALLAKRFPEHAHLAKWHLCAIDSGPMHYEANAIFWAEIAQGKRERKPGDPDPIVAFKHTVVWGALEGETDDAMLRHILTCDADFIRTFLAARLPALMKKFHAEIDEAFPGMWDAALAL